MNGNRTLNVGTTRRRARIAWAAGVMMGLSVSSPGPHHATKYNGGGL
jgi:hypothetical protein